MTRDTAQGQRPSADRGTASGPAPSDVSSRSSTAAWSDGRLSDRKQEVRQVAAKLFAHNGYEATGTRDLAAALGIQPGSVYAHISSKEELLYEILLEAGNLGEQSLRRVAESGRPARDRLVQALKVALVETAKHLDLARLLEREWLSLSGERREEIVQRRDQIERHWARIIEDGIAEGTFRCDPKFGRLFVLSLERHFVHWFQPDGPLTAEQVADRLTPMVLAGLTAGTQMEQPVADQESLAVQGRPRDDQERG